MGEQGIMIIEKLKKEDLKGLLELYKELLFHEGTVENTIQIYEKMLLDPQYLIVVAKEDSKIVGSAMAICCQCLSFAGAPFLVIEDVIVEEGLRGKGIGKRIMEKIDEFAIENHCAYAILVSSDYRKEAHIFYEKVGFTDGVRGFRKIY